MPYDGENSRRTLTTPAGSEYIELTVYPFGSDDKALVCVPANLADGADVVMLLVAHGHGGNEGTINGTAFTPIRQAAIDKGWIVASAFASGNAWGNAEALTDYRRVHDWIDSNWNITDALLHGASMGGLTMLLAYARNEIPNVRGMVGIDSVTDLRQRYDSTHKSTITAAYGIASNGSDYATKTAGRDPNLLAASDFFGKRMFMAGSPADEVIPYHLHTQKFTSQISGYPATLETRVGAGLHVAPENYFPSETIAFYEFALTAPPVENVTWPTPPPLPDGIVEVELYMMLDGVVVRIEPMV